MKAKVKRKFKMILVIGVLTLIIGGSERDYKETIITTTKQDIIGVAPVVIPKIRVSANEREYLARLLFTEARGESVECQKAVVSVVINRGSDIISTIKAKGQFDLGNKLDNVTPLEAQYNVVDYVIENGITIPDDIIYFRSEHYHTWAKDYTQIDNMFFSR